MPELRSSFYRRWIAANGWAEAAGLGTTFLLGRAAAPMLEQHTSWGGALLGALGAVVLGVLLEGVVVGRAQAQVLHSCVHDLSTAAWVKATMLGAGVAWLLGMVPSTVAALARTAPTDEVARDPSGAVQYALALLLGAVTGPVLGVGQWLVLRRYVPRAGRWIGANAFAWAIGMAVIFLGMDRVPWSRGGLAVVFSVYLVCAVAGVVVGAIHGRILRRLLREARLAASAVRRAPEIA